MRRTGKARSVGGTRQTCREPCLVWGHAGAQEATLWSREESLASHPTALPGVLCSSGIPRGGHMDRIVALRPALLPAVPATPTRAHCVIVIVLQD